MDEPILAAGATPIGFNLKPHIVLHKTSVYSDIASRIDRICSANLTPAHVLLHPDALAALIHEIAAESHLFGADSLTNIFGLPVLVSPKVTWIEVSTA